MGKLVEGVWRDDAYEYDEGGGFVRDTSRFRGWVTADGGSGFPAVAGRYRLYVSLACPWAHRTLIFRKLKGLEEAIPVTVVEPLMLEHGWEFSARYPEPLYGLDFLWQLYVRANPEASGRVTVPVLWDTEEETIVSNESSEIIRMLNSAFEGLAGPGEDYYPEPLRAEIDEVNERVYETVNNGVYRAGFASTQEAYDDAVAALFASLDWLEGRLEGRQTLIGDQVTEADWRLFTTLVRFDAVYHGHFKCNVRRLSDYPRLTAYCRRLADTPGIRETIDLDYTKTHYYGSHRDLNPRGIVPRGPAQTFLDG